MRFQRCRIPILILISNAVLFAVVLIVINLRAPRRFESDARKTLYKEWSVILRMMDGTDDPDAEYDEATYLTGNITFFYLEDPPARSEGSAKSGKRRNYLKNYGAIMAEEQQEIRQFCAKNHMQQGRAYTHYTDQGMYVLMMFKDPIGDGIHGEESDVIMYINILPFVQYSYSWNWILVALFVGISVIMVGIGFRLSKSMERTRETERRFFQNSSHELKTPLMAIQGYADGIRSGIGDPVSSADVILRESERMSKLVGELLAISKIDAKQMKLKKLRVDIREVLYDCIRIEEPLAAELAIQIRPDFSEREVLVNCDEEQMTRAIGNIIVNGLAYAKETVTINCEQEDRTAVIRIRDDGKGIPKENLPHLFERFYTNSKGGTGIGLALASDIIRLHKGTVTAENAEPGVAFEVRLPICE